MKEINPERKELQKVKNVNNLKYLYKIILSFVSISLIFSCGISDIAYDRDYYDIINLTLNKAKEGRDSIYLISSVNKDKFYDSILNNKKLSYYHEFRQIQRAIDAGQEDIHYSFFLKNGIDLTEELSYFEKQLSQYVDLDKSKIKLEKIRYFPFGTDPWALKYNDQFTNYYFSLRRPLFTKRGDFAIVSYKSIGGGHYFIIFKKTNGIWVESAKLKLGVS